MFRGTRRTLGCRRLQRFNDHLADEIWSTSQGCQTQLILLNDAVVCPSLLRRTGETGSGTSGTVDPQSEMGGGSKAGSAAGSVEASGQASGHRFQAKVQAKASF